MRFAAAMTRHDDVEKAAEQLIESVRFQMPGELDLLVVFLTFHFRDEASQLAARLRMALSPRVLMGCTCEGVIGGDREIEGEPAVTLLAAQMPGVTLNPFHIAVDEWDYLLEEDDEDRFRRRVGIGADNPDDTRAVVLLADPFTVNTAPQELTQILQRLDECAPNAPVVGGMASGAGDVGQNVLLLNGRVLDEGVIGLRIGGNLRVEAIVSQGCSPIGTPLLVTKAEGNLIYTLGGKPALEATREMLNTLSPEEQELLQNDLFMGIVVNEYQQEFDRGDFLIRQVLGADPDSGAVAIADLIRAGQTVQYHVRDAHSADEDLRKLMSRAAEDVVAPAGALLFSCNGRGTHLFDMPNHDVRGVLEAVPETPLAGFFAQGELGPIGGRSFVHGHTASILLFRPDTLINEIEQR